MFSPFLHGDICHTNLELGCRGGSNDLYYARNPQNLRTFTDLVESEVRERK